MATIQINNVNFYYELHGKGHPFVLIAGYNCDHIFWTPMLDELAKRFQILIFDNPGIGQTKDDGAALTIEKMAELTISLINKLGLSRPHILGQSMGSAIAQSMARHYPENVNKLILLNTFAKLNARTLGALKGHLLLRKLNIPLTDLVKVGLPWFFSPAFLSDEKNILTYIEIVKKNPFPQLIPDQERQLEALKLFNSNPWLSEIKSPTLVIAGEKDIVALPEDCESIAREIAGAKFKLLSSAHAIEKPNEINKAVLEFLI